MRHLFILLFAATVGTFASASYGQVIQVDYTGFSVWLDCERRGAVRFRYEIGKDTGNIGRLHSFKLDKDVPERCQQTSNKTYSHSTEKYDRGHLVPANHLDHLEAGIRESNFMTNVLPQARKMNRGAWLRSEEIIECYRDEEPLLILGGVIYGDDPEDDHFVSSHTIETPDSFWKVIISETEAIAWIVPNHNDAKRGKLDEYLVTINQLEAELGRTLDQEFDEDLSLSDEQREMAWEASWEISGCDLS